MAIQQLHQVIGQRLPNMDAKHKGTLWSFRIYCMSWGRNLSVPSKLQIAVNRTPASSDLPSLLALLLARAAAASLASPFCCASAFCPAGLLPCVLSHALALALDHAQSLCPHCFSLLRQGYHTFCLVLRHHAEASPCCYDLRLMGHCKCPCSAASLSCLEEPMLAASCAPADAVIVTVAALFARNG